MTILVYAEHDNNALKPATLNAVTAALQLGGEVTVLVAGSECKQVAEAAAQIAGVSRVMRVEEEACRHQLAEVIAPLLQKLAPGFTHIVAPATTTGKNILPRAAALLDTQMISDVIAIESADTFVRPIYAGNALATVQSKDALKLLTVRGTAFAPAAMTGGSAAIVSVDLLPAEQENKASSFVAQELSVSARPELTAARLIVSGGRALGSKDNFKIIEDLADSIGAAVGASRAAVDAGYAPNDWQVGQTGKIVAPELYMAVGMSGAIQHLAGMKDSKVIVAINKDPDAPIFQVADYGLVGDLFEIVPQLQAALKQ